MKKLLYVIPIAAAMLLGACEKSPLTRYEEGNTIYFRNAGYMSGREPSPSDSLTYSFMYEKADTVFVVIPVSVAGKMQPVDRPYVVVADTGSTAAFDKEIILGPTVIRANRLNDTLLVKLVRTPQMKTETMLMRLKLLPNEHFETNFPDRSLSGVDRKLPYHVFRVYINDFMSRPTRWTDAYLGVYSIKKAQLLTELFGFDFEKDYVPPYGPTSQINFVMAGGYAMQRYLNEMEEAGTPVLEEDGSRMIMGDYVQ